MDQRIIITIVVKGRYPIASINNQVIFDTKQNLFLCSFTVSLHDLLVTLQTYFTLFHMHIYVGPLLSYSP